MSFQDFKYFNWSNLKSDRNVEIFPQSCHFPSYHVEGKCSQAWLKREIDNISKLIFEIDIKIQSFQRQGLNKPHISSMQEA